MEKEELYQKIRGMIVSSSKKPKYVSLSTVKMAEMFGMERNEIEHMLLDLLNEGRLKKSQMADPPHNEIYLLP